MFIKISTTFCTCQKCGHTWTVRIKPDEAPREIIFLHPATVVEIDKEVRKCPACHAKRWDLTEDGRTLNAKKTELDKKIDL